MNSRSDVRPAAGIGPHTAPTPGAPPAAEAPSAATAAMLRDLVRDEVVLSAGIWVVKVGTSVLAGGDGTLDPARIHHLAEQISAVMDSGRKVALVSSGAVGAGMGQLNLKRRPDNLRQLQAAAAVGQSYLIRAYDEGLRRHGRHAAQLLLTHEDFDSRPRYLNMRNTLHALFEYNAVPVINENDTISVDEIKFGDNDRLAAMVTNLLQAPLLVILSVVDGLYRNDPSTGTRTALVSLVPQIDDSILNLADSSRSTLGTGGMHSKLASARLVTQAGGSVIIASGKSQAPLSRILAGEPVGTLFLAHGQTHRAASAGSVWRRACAATSWWTRAHAWPSRAAARACWRSGSSRSSASSTRATSSPSATPRDASSPGD